MSSNGAAATTGRVQAVWSTAAAATAIVEWRSLHFGVRSGARGRFALLMRQCDTVADVVAASTRLNSTKLRAQDQKQFHFIFFHINKVLIAADYNNKISRLKS